MESAYEECLCYELSQLGLNFRKQVHSPVRYKSVRLACGYVMDVVVEDTVVLEIKSVEELLPVHGSQLLTYLKCFGRPVNGSDLPPRLRVSELKDGFNPEQESQ